MRKHGVSDGDLAVKESKFLIIRRSLVRCPDGRMFPLVMLLIPIDLKTVCLYQARHQFLSEFEQTCQAFTMATWPGPLSCKAFKVQTCGNYIP